MVHATIPNSHSKKAKMPSARWLLAAAAAAAQLVLAQPSNPNLKTLLFCASTRTPTPPTAAHSSAR